jgi:hypothetical protein
VPEDQQSSKLNAMLNDELVKLGAIAAALQASTLSIEH